MNRLRPARPTRPRAAARRASPRAAAPFAALLLVPLGGCHDTSAPLAPLEPPQAVASPAGPDSGEPNLFGLDDGSALMNWTEAAPDGGHALRFARWDGSAWSEARTVAAGSGWFVNWADFPSVVTLPDGSHAAHWLVRSAASRYAYDVHLARSFDAGESWSPPISPHDDGTPTEHGFVSLFPHDGKLGAVWLDGRAFAGVDTTDAGGHAGAADMALRFATIDRDGAIADETVLDARTCECCQTAAAVTADGPIVAYRDRSAGEIRDIHVVRWSPAGWSEPAPLHDDGWHITGCPVNGPALAARDRRVAAAWFTAANDEARVLVAFSDDAGATFGAPVRIDDGDPSGRVGVLLLDDGSALVSWLERTADAAQIHVRRAAADGRISPATPVAATTGERASGFPRMTRAGEAILFAWTEPGSPRRVHVATAPLPR